MPISKADIKNKISRNSQLQQKKLPWLDLFQLLGQFVDTRRMDFQTTQQPGEFLNREIFDSTAPKASKTCASSILSALWPQSVKRFRFTPPRKLKLTTINKEYYEEITRRQMSVMDDPDGGLQLALDEYMHACVVFGTAGVEIMPHPKLKVCYRAWGVKHLKIAEGADGRVDTVYIEFKWPLHMIAKEYGIEKMSSKLQELYKNQKFDEEFSILIAIEPRRTTAVGARGKDAMPFESCHIELETEHALREGGFTEMPIKVGRFFKLLGEDYGRSPAMDALPDVLEANTIWEAVTIAIEKTLDPPLGVLDDGKLGGSEIDTSAGAINVFNISGRAGDKNPIFPLFTVGETKQSVQLLEQLSNSISNHFFLDRLLDFNNETRMTLGETNLRNKLRNSTLGGIYTRQIVEVISQNIQRTFNILLEAGEFGYPASDPRAQEPGALVIPEEVVKLMASGENVYEIEYFTPALRIMQAEEADGILRAWEMAGVLAGGVPQALDNLDEDKSVQIFANIVGAPSEIRRSQEAIDLIRNARQAAIQEQQQMEAAKQASEAARNVGQSGLVPLAQQQHAGQKK